MRTSLRRRYEQAFNTEKNRMLKIFNGPALTKAEKKVDKLMQKHLAGYTGVISHSTWRALRAAVAKLVR